MIHKLTRTTTRVLAILFAMFATTGAWAAVTIPAANSISGGDESYKHIFRGTDSAGGNVWDTLANWKTLESDTSVTDATSSESWSDDTAVPFFSGGDYNNAALLHGSLMNVAAADGKKAITVSTLDGYQLKLALYDNVQLTVSSLKFITALDSEYVYVDSTSKFIVTALQNNNWNNQVNYYVASPGGITYNCAFSVANNAATINYNLIGDGSVIYGGAVSSASHVIKRADVELKNSAEATKTVESKKLVGFTSSTKSFSVGDGATINVTGTAGTMTKTLTSVNSSGDTSLTTENDPGTCELVQKSDGVYLYYVENGVPTKPTWTPKQIAAVLGGTLVDNTYNNWSSVPSSGDDVILSITGDSVLMVDDEITLGRVHLVNSASTEGVVTLTVDGSTAIFTASEVVVPDNVILKVIRKSGDVNPILSAPVTVQSGGTLDIAVGCTWGQVISGAGKVKVSANAVTFSEFNPFTGGLTVAAGGVAKAGKNAGDGTTQTCFGNTSQEIVVEDGGTLDIANTSEATYALRIAGTGVNNQGAVVSRSAFSYGARNVRSITLTADATITCDVSWGIVNGGYNDATLALGSYTLTKKGSAEFWLCNTTISGTGKFYVLEGKLRPTDNRASNCNDGTIQIGNGAELKLYDASSLGANLSVKNLICDAGGTITVPNSYTLTISTLMSVGGTATIEGTLSGDGAVELADKSASVSIKKTNTQVPELSDALEAAYCKMKTDASGESSNVYTIDVVAQDSNGGQYHTIADAIAAITADQAEETPSLSTTVTLILDTDEPVQLPAVGYAIDSRSVTYTGAVTGASGVAIDGTTVAGVFTGVTNTASTWTDSSGDHLWSNPQNWSTKSVPTAETTVTFSSGTWNVYTETSGSVGSVASMVVDGAVSLAYDSEMSDSTGITVAGNITGSGTLKLQRAGIYKSVGKCTISPNIVVENNGSNESFLSETTSGSFELNGTLEVTGLFKATTSVTCNGSVTLNDNSSSEWRWTPVFNSSFTVGANASALFGNYSSAGYYYPTFNAEVTLNAGSVLSMNAGDNPAWGAGGTLHGSGTIRLTNVQASDALKTRLQDSAEWTGTLEYSGNIDNVDFSGLANDNSAVGVRDLTGSFAANADATMKDVAAGIKTFRISGSEGLKINNTIEQKNFIIRSKIIGSGPINLGISKTVPSAANTVKLIFTGDMSEFTGEVKFSASSYRCNYVFATEDDLNAIPAATWYGQILVTEHAVVPVNALWNGTGGFILNGTLNVGAGGALTCHSGDKLVAGSGTINYGVLPTAGHPSTTTIPIFSDSWTGQVVLPATTLSVKTGVPLIGLSSNNGRIVVKGITRSSDSLSIHLNSGTAKIKGTVQLDGDLFITDANSSATYTWNKVTGSGNMTVTKGTGSASGVTHAITTLDDYTGILETKTFSLTIGTVNVSTLDLTVGNPIVKLANGCNLTTPVDNIAVKVDGVATSHKLFKASDGYLYVKVASVTLDDTTTTYYPTIAQAAKAATDAFKAGTLTGSAAVFNLLDSEAPTSLLGWDYADGTFTRNGNVAAIGESEYASLQAAIDAASSEADAPSTISLIYDCDDSAVNPNGKTFVFDENGWAFDGKFAGAGTILIVEEPSSTTWSASRFVSSGDTLWTGTVTLDWGCIDYRDDTTSPKHGDIVGVVNKYGTVNSTVEIGKNSWTEGNCYFNGNTTPKLKVSGYLYINDGSSQNKRTIGNVCGDGVFVFGDKASTVYYGITNLDDWNGILTNLSANVTIGTVTRGNGVIYCSKAPSTLPTFTNTDGNRWSGTYIIGWNPNADGTQVLFSQYGVAGSTVAITGMAAGYLSTRGDTESLIQQNTIPATVRLDGNVKVTNGWQSDLPAEGSWPSATASDNGARQVIFSRLSGVGDFWCAYTGANWTSAINQHFVIQSLDGTYSGTLKIGKWFAIKLAAVDFTAEPAQNSKLIKVEVDNTEGAKGTFRNSANMNIAQNGGLVDVTVNGTPSDTKLFLGDGGLYVAAVSVTINDVTTYYQTIAAAKAVVGNDPVTFNLLADVSENVALAYGQMLDKGTTTYTGTVSAADSSAKIVLDGTTYKVKYGTIFSVY